MAMNFTLSGKSSLCRILVLFTLYTWTVLAFPSKFHLTATTYALLLSGTTASSRSIGRRPFRLHAVLEKSTSLSGSETETSVSSSPVLPYEKQILNFLSIRSRQFSSSLLEQFHIQGWRWHTKSLARDAGRLQNLALKTDPNNAVTLKDACDFVIGFNMMGLHRVEASLFFPWMKEKLTNAIPNNTELCTAFSSAMDALENDRLAVASLGDDISKQAMLACDTKAIESHRAEAIAEVAKHSAELSNLVHRMMSIEDTLLVPAIGAIVPPKEQKSFNSKVLRRLGLLDSRLHLVGMYEAVWEGDDSTEKELFEGIIPGFTRKLIPRWKRKLYQPKTYMME